MQTSVTNIAANSYPSLSIYRVCTLLTVNKVSTNCGLLSAFSIDKARLYQYIFLLFQQYKTLAVPYLSIFNRIKPQQ